MNKIILGTFLCLSILSCSELRAQEVNATVVIDSRLLVGQDRTALSGLANDVQSYINSYYWTGGSWTYPQVAMSIQISPQSSGGGNYNAQLLLISSRSVAGGSDALTVFRIIDNNWQFSYSPNQPLQHTPGIFNPLSSMIDCYVYIALGMTADSYNDLGGSPYFHQASSICGLGQSNSASGWAESQGADYSRTSFVEELLNPRFETIRHLAYTYYHGRDILTTQPDSGYKAVLNAIDSLDYFKQGLGGTSLTLDRFMDAKYLELGQFVQVYPDKGTIYDELEAIDPSHQTYYEDFRNK